MRLAWQSYDCPIQGVDMDLDDDDMVYAGQMFRCSWCGQMHPAEIVETAVWSPDGSYISLPLPANAEELAALP